MTKAIIFICLAGAMVFLAAGALELFTRGYASSQTVIGGLNLLVVSMQIQIIDLQKAVKGAE